LKTYQPRRLRAQIFSSKYNPEGFRRNFLENVNPALKELQKLTKDGWQV